MTTVAAGDTIRADDNNDLETRLAAAEAALADGSIPGQLIGDPSSVTSDSSTFTTSETEVQTITAATVTGRRYSVTWNPKFVSSAANDQVRINIREDSSAGTNIQSAVVSTMTTGQVGGTGSITAFYTADATENKVFSFTAQRVSGTGNINLEAAADRPSLAWVRYEDTP